MASMMNDTASPRLERSCDQAPTDWIRIAPSFPGLERIEAYFSGHAFGRHRHDTYAIGFTVRGIQSFEYRGVSKCSVPGQVFVLHPDETHDGHAGTEDGFHYRIAYVEPGAIQDALGGGRRPLPFVRDAVSNDRTLAAAIMPVLEDLDAPLDPLRCDEIISNLSDALAAADPSCVRRKTPPRHWNAVNKARALISANLEAGIASCELEALTGLSRYELARHFRACLGTSPYRYLIMRRLDRVHFLIRQGVSLSDAALGAGFADQSHMTRHFKRIYGVSPGRWTAMVAKAS